MGVCVVLLNFAGFMFSLPTIFPLSFSGLLVPLYPSSRISLGHISLYHPNILQ